MQAILIDPWTQTISTVERTQDYKSVYPLISHEHHVVSTFDLCRLDDGDAIYVDDEGLNVDPHPPMFIIGEARLAGKGLVCGSDSQGNCTEPKITIDELKKLVGWQLISGLDLWIRP